MSAISGMYILTEFGFEILGIFVEQLKRQNDYMVIINTFSQSSHYYSMIQYINL